MQHHRCQAEGPSPYQGSHTQPTLIAITTVSPSTLHQSQTLLFSLPIDSITISQAPLPVLVTPYNPPAIFALYEMVVAGRGRGDLLWVLQTGATNSFGTTNSKPISFALLPQKYVPSKVVAVRKGTQL